MLNQVILVGRLVYDPELRKLDDGTSVTTIVLAVQRGYKSAQSGEYDTDFLRCTLWRGIAENTVQYCKKGSTVGVKARLQQKNHECHHNIYTFFFANLRADCSTKEYLSF